MHSAFTSFDATNSFLSFSFLRFIYPIIGLDMKIINKVFIFLGFQMLLCNCAVALSNMCSCLFVSIEMSTVVLACAMEITRLYSAFFVSPKQLDDYKNWAVRLARII